LLLLVVLVVLVVLLLQGGLVAFVGAVEDPFPGN
jgi:hypothetical protein